MSTWLVYFFLFPLIRDLQFVYVMHLMQFWPGAKHSSINAMSIRSPELEAFIVPFIQLKSLINMESNDAYSQANWGQNFHESEKRKNKEKREIITLLLLDSCSCVSFSLLFSWAKLYYNICLHLRSKLTIKRILSFSLTSRATAHNNTNLLTFAILEHESPFFSGIWPCI